METVQVAQKGAVVTVQLNRPEVKNAFNEVLIKELTETFRNLPANARVVVLEGAGDAFCAGADVNWMKQSKGYTEEENARDARAMAGMYRALDECPKPVIGKIRGFALGGGSGLVACCDIPLAADGTVFGFTEVRLGIVPANISTFVLPKIGIAAARRYFLTGERFGTRQAHEIGLIAEAVPADQLDARVDAFVAELLKCGPNAVSIAKKLIPEVSSRARDAAIEYTIATIAKTRVSPEGQEGLSAFLEKRKPKWTEP